ncbi:MAG: ATP-binding protein [Kiritimatiellae bacterium]|nr:ATP-binding protein [Eggerthellaceae bacterium]MBQ6329349.1 ATP-binding protein [Kiritimatiellia bacterium]
MRSITIPATDEDPEPIVEFVGEELAKFDCPQKALYQIEVAIEEILVNIVSYAGLSDADGVEVRCEVLDDPLRVVVQFLDGGVPFDPLAKADPDITPEAIMEREGGLGIFMVKKMMDDVSYVYENGKNTLTILKRL